MNIQNNHGCIVVYLNRKDTPLRLRGINTATWSSTPTTLITNSRPASKKSWFWSCTSGVRRSPCRQLTRNVSQPSLTSRSLCPRTRGCWFLVVILPCRRRVCLPPFLVWLHCERIAYWLRILLIDELPALKDGSTWVSRFRKIVDYLRQYSDGKWDLDQGLDEVEKADNIACVKNE